MIDAELQLALRKVAVELADAKDPWWIIGSAAVALLGGDGEGVADVDVIVSRRDIDVLFERLPLKDTPDTTKTIFQSERFGLWLQQKPHLDVEFMAGLTVRSDGQWRPVVLQTRQAIQIGKGHVFVPERDELIGILQQFGREKDLRRAASLMRD